MKITLDQAEVSAAVRMYISGQGIGLEGKTLEVDYTMSRGEGRQALVASVTIENGLQVPDLPASITSVTATVTPIRAAQPEAAASLATDDAGQDTVSGDTAEAPPAKKAKLFVD